MAITTPVINKTSPRLFWISHERRAKNKYTKNATIIKGTTLPEVYISKLKPRKIPASPNDPDRRLFKPYQQE